MGITSNSKQIKVFLELGLGSNINAVFQLWPDGFSSWYSKIFSFSLPLLNTNHMHVTKWKYGRFTTRGNQKLFATVR